MSIQLNRRLFVFTGVCASLCILPLRIEAQHEIRVLARVDAIGSVLSSEIPVYALLQDAAGQSYALTIAGESQIEAFDRPFQILDKPAGQPSDYLVLREGRPGAKKAAAGRVTVLHDDGAQWLVRVTGRTSDELADLGFMLYRLPAKPIVWTAPQPLLLRPTGAASAATILATYDPLVAEIVNHVQQTNLYLTLKRLSGEEPAIAWGNLTNIYTRHTTAMSAIPVTNAAAFASEQLQALGLSVRYCGWSNGGYSGRNVEAVQIGGALSNEIVVIVAHLDDMPSSGRAPGADDNGSGSAAVLTAASVLRQYAFDRTIYYVLVTGEEQGLLGSAVYAANAKTAGLNMVAVLNLDMIAWDSVPPPTLNLYTHSVGAPTYSNEMAIATTFTNVVAAYGLTGSLAPVIYNNSGMVWSDHASFWNQSYAAILAIEAYGSDFNAYYHTSNDNLAHCNVAYFTAFAQAAIGTLATLAGPTNRIPFDAIEVVNSDWIPGSGVGAGVFFAQHADGATENGADTQDRAWADAYTNPNPAWLKISSIPYGSELRSDARPTNSETIFRGKLAVVATNASIITDTNRLRFAFLTGPDSNRIYTVKIHVDGEYTLQSNDFEFVQDLREVVASGGHVGLPSLKQVSNGVYYGTCDIGARFLNRDSTNCLTRTIIATGSNIIMTLAAQVGTHIVDAYDVSTNLLDPDGWQSWISYTNDIAPDATNFESGWQTITRVLDYSDFTASPAWFFRFKRHWTDW
jgi:hypothetical protein